MKRWAWLLLAGLVGACTGTFEELPPALVVMATEQSVRFFNAKSLQPTPEAPPTVTLGTWNLGEPVQALLKPDARQELWVLSTQNLRLFPVAGLSTRANPFPQPQPLATLPLGQECNGGYLRAGQDHLLAVCGLRVWRVPYASPSLQALDVTGLPEGTRFALGPQDELLYLNGNLLSYKLQDPVELRIDNPNSLPARDLVFEGFSGRAYALFSDPFRSLGVAWTPAPNSTPTLADFTRGNLNRLSAGRFGVVALGNGGLVRLDTRRNGPTFPFSLGLAAADGYFYAVLGNLIFTYDLLAQDLVTPSQRDVGFSPVALAFMVVPE